MWTIGQRVFGKRQELPHWYPGTVRHVDGGRCYVIFDDGEDALLDAERLRAFKLRAGDRIAVRTAVPHNYAPATVTALEGEQVRVRYDSGNEEWTKLAQVRLQPEARKPVQQAAPPVRHAIGEHVLVCWHDLYWYPGVILAVDGDQFHVIFDNGNQVVVSTDSLRAVTVGVGDRVLCRWKGGPAYYPGEITRRDGEVIHVSYDDGDEETTLLRLARLERDDWFPPGALAGVKEGDRVLACWYDQNWYPGVIVSVSGKRIHVLYDDGDQAMVTPDRVKALAFKVGDRVCCRRGGGPIFYPGEITKQQGEVIHIQYENGEEETTSIRLVRVEREGLRDGLNEELE
jgi:hypothetical protein